MTGNRNQNKFRADDGNQLVNGIRFGDQILGVYLMARKCVMRICRMTKEVPRSTCCATTALFLPCALEMVALRHDVVVSPGGLVRKSRGIYNEGQRI